MPTILEDFITKTVQWYKESSSLKAKKEEDNMKYPLLFLKEKEAKESSCHT